MESKPLPVGGWTKHDRWAVPGMRIPAFRSGLAAQKGTNNNILIKTWGGIGDQICSEPTLRYAREHFKKVRLTLVSPIPEVFSHIKFDDVYNNTQEWPIYDDYLCLETNSETDKWNLFYQFVSHNVVHCVDFPCLSALRSTLPVDKKVVRLIPPTPGLKFFDLLRDVDLKKCVVVHAGKHWQSKTFPKAWWDAAINSITEKGLTPILIGKENGPGQGTVDTTVELCIDMREKTTLLETIWLLQNVPVVICNDSSPLHMAVTGTAWIGFLATAKHFDYITHWRNNMRGIPEWGWQMQNLSLGGYWDIQDFSPGDVEDKTIDKVDPKILESWLPKPETIGAFCHEKHNIVRI